MNKSEKTAENKAYKNLTLETAHKIVPNIHIIKWIQKEVHI